MHLAEFLRNRNADLPAIVDNARASVGLADSDVLLAVGSLVEELGNSKSDVDLVLVTPRDDDTVPAQEVAVVVGTCVSDVLILPRRKLEALMGRFHAWAASPWNVTAAAPFSLEDRRLLHRLRHNVLVFEGGASQWAELQPSLEDLARLKLQVARHMARTIQIDMAGNREADDEMTLTFAAQDLLGQAIDALTAGHLLTNPTPKWRSRLLRRLPRDWESNLRVRPIGLDAPSAFWSLHRAPERPERQQTLAFAARIATFARAAFVWAERRLVSEAPGPSGDTGYVHASSPEAPLPHLDFDVDYAEFDGGAQLGRLNEFAAPIELSAQEFELALLFDGVTTPREAVHAVYGAHATATEYGRISALVAKIKDADLALPLQPAPAIQV